MRSSWTRTLLLGLVLGPAPATAERAPDAIDREEPAVRRAKEGHTVSGTDFLVWDEDPQEATAWAAELAELVGGDGGLGEFRGWGDVARRTAGQPLFLSDEVLEQMAAWRQAPDERRTNHLLGFMLCLLPSIERTYLISTWATSPSETLRRDLARALSVPFEATGVGSVLDHLTQDPSEEVRALAMNAVERRRRPAA